MIRYEESNRPGALLGRHEQACGYRLQGLAAWEGPSQTARPPELRNPKESYALGPLHHDPSVFWILMRYLILTMVPF